MAIFDRVKEKFKDVVGESEGTAGRNEFAGLKDPTPYETFYSNGMFVGHKGSGRGYRSNIFLYFKFPEDVKVDWTSSYRESAENQSFFTDIVNEIGGQIQNTSTRARKDKRIRFHMPFVREISDSIAKYDGITPAHSDFIDRMGGFEHPIWHSYLGIELQKGSIHEGLYSFNEKVRNYADYMTSSSTEIDYRLYRESMLQVTNACLDYGMRPLDFKANPEDFYRIAAAFGEDDPVYDIKPDLSTTTIALPEHDRSIFVGGTELSFYAIRPKQNRDIFDKNPLSPSGVNFGKALLSPNLNIVHINIRGEIRSPESTATLFDDRLTKGDYKESTGSNDTNDKSHQEIVKARKDMSRAEIFAEEAGSMQFSWIDNCEITVARVVDGNKSELNKRLSPFDLEAVNIVGRQQIALASTIPCYPNSIFKVPSSDKKRNPNVNNFYAGVLSLSGLFRSTKPCGPGGILLGLSDSGFEFKEVYIETDASYRHKSPPTILLTGSSGSGKALPLDAKLLTPDGNYILMKDVKVGTELLSPDGTVTKVTYKTPVQKNHTVFDMKLADSQSHISDANHQWIVKENVPFYKDKEPIYLVDRLLEFDDKLEKLIKTINSGRHENILATDILNAEEIHQLIRRIGSNKCQFSNPQSLQASLSFVGVHEIKEDGEIKWNIIDALEGVRERVSQRLETVSWRDDDPQITRLTTLEMYHNGLMMNPTSGRGSKVPKFSILASSAVEFAQESKPDIDPLVAGFIISALPLDSKDGAKPKCDWGTGHIVENLKAISVRQRQAMFDEGYRVENALFGSIHIGKDQISDMKSKIVEYSDEKASLLPEFLNMSKENRMRFIQGLVDGCPTYRKERNQFIVHVPSSLLEEVANIIRSMGSPAFISKNKSTIAFYLDDLKIGDFDIKSPVPSVDNSGAIIPILEISECDTTDVQCIQVDNDYSAYLIEGFTPTSNTVEALMIAAQFKYVGQQVIYINPKPDSSLKPFFDMLGGTTINMTTKYLKDNPGLLDPMFFIEDRATVGRMLAEMIMRARRMTQDFGAKSSDQMESLKTELLERAKMPANECSYDIIFGNSRHSANTPRITDDDIVEFVRNKMSSSPIWKATISQNPDERERFQKLFSSGAPLLIEWDNTIVLPDENTNPAYWTPDEIDSIQSAINLFDYSAETIGNGRRGGILIVDEAHVLRNSQSLMDKVNKAGAMWRARNINLLLATQNISTFADGESEYDISPSIRLFIMMQTTDKELKHFYRITGLPEDQRHSEYMRNAGIKSAGGRSKSIPNAYILDRTYEWSGGIICGPFPQRELAAAIIDVNNVKTREKALKELQENMMIEEDYDIENDPEVLRDRIREQESRTSFG